MLLILIIIGKKWLKSICMAALVVLAMLLCAFAYHNWDIWTVDRALPAPLATSLNWDYQKVFEPFAPAAEGYSVLIDLDSKTLTLYEDGLSVKSWPVSGGTKENPSPVGAWTVSGISNWGEGFGGSWIALSVPWGKLGPRILGKQNLVKMRSA